MALTSPDKSNSSRNQNHSDVKHRTGRSHRHRLAKAPGGTYAERQSILLRRQCFPASKQNTVHTGRCQQALLVAANPGMTGRISGKTRSSVRKSVRKVLGTEKFFQIRECFSENEKTPVTVDFQGLQAFFIGRSVGICLLFFAKRKKYSADQFLNWSAQGPAGALRIGVQIPLPSSLNEKIVPHHNDAVLSSGRSVGI